MSDFAAASSSSKGVAAPATGAKCNTCKALFVSTEVVKEHYRSEWHIFNSKRRSSNLAPLSLEDFRKVYPSLNKKPSSSSSRATSKLTSKIGKADPTQIPKISPARALQSSGSVKANAGIAMTSPAAHASAPAAAPDRTSGPVSVSAVGATERVHHSALGEKGEIEGEISVGALSEYKDMALKLGIQPERVDGILKLALEKDLVDPLFEDCKKTEDDGRGREEEEEEEEEEEVEGEALEITANMSIFDDKIFDTVDACIEYMASKFGFFIPDREFIVDLEGMLIYLGEKVKLGGYCLYCQKQFKSGRACQVKCA